MPNNDISPLTVTKQICLNGQWQFRQSGNGPWLPAQVPGCNFSDLLKNNVIDDPFYRNEEHQLQWIEKENWHYQKSFTVNQELLLFSDVELVLEGLDTYCQVYVNNILVHENNNMFVGHRISCKEWLCVGDNELRIEFRSPINEVMPTHQKNGFTYPAENDKSEERLSVFTRKAPYHYGWDWGPRFVTSGVWRDIRLEAIDKARIDDIYVQQQTLSDEQADLIFQVTLTNITSLDGDDFTGFIDIQCDNVDGLSQQIPVQINGSESMVNIPLSINNPKRWWPNGLGEAFLHQFSVTLTDKQKQLDTQNIAVGLRTIEVVNEEDQHGESFYIKVNGHAIFMKGANYIPSDSLLDRVSSEKYQKIFADAVAANMNMLRVWGGGIYENEEFYRLADEQGILIWQDFMFACSLYPGDADFINNVQHEVIYNVKRLRNHACLALWCGNNETEMGIEFWHWPKTFSYSDELYQRLKEDYDLLFKQVLPEMVRALDPARFYFSSSPIGFWENKADDNRGDNHYWGVWHGEEPFSEFKNRVPRFMSEYGFQSFPIMASVKEYSIEEDWHLESSVMKTHQKHPRGNSLIRQYMTEEYRVPKDFESFLYLSQVQQSLGMKVAFEAHRSAMPFCMGSLYWQFNDCWPVASWSGIDYYGRWKAMHYQAKRSFEHLAVFVDQTENELSVNIVSDLINDASLELSQQLMTLDGAVLWSKVQAIDAKGLTSEVIVKHELPVLLDKANRTDVVFVTALLEVNTEVLVSEAFHYFVATKELSLKRPNYQVTSKEGDETIEFVIQVDTLAKQVHLTVDDNLNNFTDNFFDLLPGVEKHISLPIDSANAVSTNIISAKTALASLKIMSVVDTY
jgi:beta-mannosidase